MTFLQSHKKPSEIRKLDKALGKKRAYRRMLRDNPILAGKANRRAAPTSNNRGRNVRMLP